MVINEILISRVLERNVENVNFSSLGLINSTTENTLSFIDDEKFLSEALLNSNLKGIFVTEEFREKFVKRRPDLFLILCSDPRYYFYKLQNQLTDLKFESSKFKSVISNSARIQEKSYISPFNVIIEENVFIEPNVTILSDVIIGRNTIIRAGVVLGAEGFEHKRTSKGILSVKHDGKVIIGSNVEIGANCAISKGFEYRNTIIGDDTKLDNLVHVAHGVQIGRGCFLPACCMIAGSTTIGNDVWIGPGASISSQLIVGNSSFITIGSVVTKNIADGVKVTGNFAVSHDQFLKIFKNNLKL